MRITIAYQLEVRMQMKKNHILQLSPILAVQTVLVVPPGFQIVFVTIFSFLRLHAAPSCPPHTSFMLFTPFPHVLHMFSSPLLTMPYPYAAVAAPTAPTCFPLLFLTYYIWYPGCYHTFTSIYTRLVTYLFFSQSLIDLLDNSSERSHNWLRLCKLS